MKKLFLFLFFIVTNLQANYLPVSKGHQNDFFYAHQTALWLVYETSISSIPEDVNETLVLLGLKTAQFNNSQKAYFILKPMKFMAGFGDQNQQMAGVSHTTEIELTLLVQPKDDPQSSYATLSDYLNGYLYNTRIGQLRLDVLADNPIAVSAGRQIFGEHKYLTLFDYHFNAPNNTLYQAKPLNFEMNTYVWNEQQTRQDLIISITTQLDNLYFQETAFNNERLYSSFPQEPTPAVHNTTLMSYRYYQPRTMMLAFVEPGLSASNIRVGSPTASPVLKPAPPFGDGQPIPGSEYWANNFVLKIQSLMSKAELKAVMSYITPPAVYEPIPTSLY